MILASHALLGAAAARLVPNNPFAGFLLGIVTHFAADAIPHWEYHLRSVIRNEEGHATNMRWNADFLVDLLKISVDIAAGILLSFLIFNPRTSTDLVILFAGISGGIFPDSLQFLYFKIKKEPFVAMQKLHQTIHAKHTLRHKPRRGIVLQILIVTTAILASILLRS